MESLEHRTIKETIQKKEIKNLKEVIKMNRFFDDDFTREEMFLLICKTKNRMEIDEILGNLEKR